MVERVRKTSPKKLAYQRAYYEKNRATVLEYQKRYAADHPTKIKASGKAYREKNKKFLDERGAEYRKNHRDAAVARSKKWIRDHPERARDTRAAWRKSNPGAMRKYQERYMATKATCLDEPFSLTDVTDYLKRQNNRCYWCCVALGKNYHVDHIIPLSKGGSNGASNVRPACGPCNLTKHNKNPMDFALQLMGA